VNCDNIGRTTRAVNTGIPTSVDLEILNISCTTFRQRIQFNSIPCPLARNVLPKKQTTLEQDQRLVHTYFF
ncbi:hypothetical protein NDU88_001388, partial [Pleurodeles waltl]